MPIENLEVESLAKNPNLELAQYKYMLTTDAYRNDKKLATIFMNSIKESNMAPFYEKVFYFEILKFILFFNYIF